MPENEMITELNHLFAEEVEAAIRYLPLAVTLKGLDRLRVNPFLMEGFAETVEHAQVVAAKIVQLGGVPRLKIHLEIESEKAVARHATPDEGGRVRPRRSETPARSSS